MMDSMTILTCHATHGTATKTFTALADGTVSKQSYDAGALFWHEERPVSGLQDIHDILLNLQNEPQKFIIRGKVKEPTATMVLRRIHGENAAFIPHPRHWMMLDIDTMTYPETMDVAVDPSEVIQWLKQQLPAPFNTTQCVYKFSSSQNVPTKLGDTPAKIVSAHLYFWCDKPVSEQEWKRFFKAHNAPIDYMIFNPVQPHYTATPIFNGMADPMPERVGVC